MIGRAFVELYVMGVNVWLSQHIERNKFKAMGQPSLRRDYETSDHIFSLCAIIKEADVPHLKSCCFVDFQKAFGLCSKGIIILETT